MTRVASVSCEAGSRPGDSICRWEGGTDLTVVVTFDGSAYPFERHCRYAAQRDKEGKFTFDNMEFREIPPGFRVGPWPGWRGVPEMPPAAVVTGREPVPLEFHWWGDELTLRRVRGVCRINGTVGRVFAVRTEDARLVPLTVDLYASPTIRIIPAPVHLPPSLASVHPRLLLHEGDLPRLRTPVHAEQSKSLDRLLDLINRWDLPLRKSAESKIPPGPEGLADEDRLLVSAYIALLFPTAENRGRAHGAYLGYLERTRDPGFEPLAIDTQAGEVLYLLAVGYDWLHDAFSPEERERVRRRLREIADICWGHLGYDRRDYAQAHFLGCGLGLLAYSLLAYAEDPRAERWIDYLHAVLRHVCSTLPIDGFFPHGLNMWIYENAFLLRWLEVFRTAGGLDLWPAAGALAASSRFRAAATSPDGLCGITMGDPQYRVGGDSWCHSLIAARTHSPASQLLGDLLRDLPVGGVDYRLAPARRRVYEHLWNDKAVPPGNPPGTVSLFPDGGQAFVRTGDSLFTFRSGGPLGEHRYRSGMTGAYGHADPCSGSFLLYSDGQLVLTGPGPVYRRDSSLQNVVTIDGQGQVGDSSVWLPDFFPPEIVPPKPEFRAEGGSLAIAADCGPAYLPHLGVVRMQRSMLVHPGRFIAGVDVVETDAVRSIEWNLHAGGEFARAGSGLPWSVKGSRQSNVRVLVLEPQSVAWSTGKTEFVPAYPHDGSRDNYLRCSVRGRNGRFVWMILLQQEPDIGRLMSGDALAGLADGSTIHFDGRWLSCRTGSESRS